MLGRLLQLWQPVHGEVDSILSEETVHTEAKKMSDDFIPEKANVAGELGTGLKL